MPTPASPNEIFIQAMTYDVTQKLIGIVQAYSLAIEHKVKDEALLPAIRKQHKETVNTLLNEGDLTKTIPEKYSLAKLETAFVKDKLQQEAMIDVALNLFKEHYNEAKTLLQEAITTEGEHTATAIAELTALAWCENNEEVAQSALKSATENTQTNLAGELFRLAEKLHKNNPQIASRLFTESIKAGKNDITTTQCEDFLFTRIPQPSANSALQLINCSKVQPTTLAIIGKAARQQQYHGIACQFFATVKENDSNHKNTAIAELIALYYITNRINDADTTCSELTENCTPKKAVDLLTELASYYHIQSKSKSSCPSFLYAQTIIITKEIDLQACKKFNLQAEHIAMALNKVGADISQNNLLALTEYVANLPEEHADINEIIKRIAFITSSLYAQIIVQTKNVDPNACRRLNLHAEHINTVLEKAGAELSQESLLVLTECVANLPEEHTDINEIIKRIAFITSSLYAQIIVQTKNVDPNACRKLNLHEEHINTVLTMAGAELSQESLLVLTEYIANLPKEHADINERTDTLLLATGVENSPYISQCHTLMQASISTLGAETKSTLYWRNKMLTAATVNPEVITTEYCKKNKFCPDITNQLAVAITKAAENQATALIQLLEYRKNDTEFVPHVISAVVEHISDPDKQVSCLQAIEYFLVNTYAKKPEIFLVAQLQIFALLAWRRISTANADQYALACLYAYLTSYKCYKYHAMFKMLQPTKFSNGEIKPKRYSPQNYYSTLIDAKAYLLYWRLVGKTSWQGQCTDNDTLNTITNLLVSPGGEQIDEPIKFIAEHLGNYDEDTRNEFLDNLSLWNKFQLLQQYLKHNALRQNTPNRFESFRGPLTTGYGKLTTFKSSGYHPNGKFIRHYNSQGYYSCGRRGDGPLRALGRYLITGNFINIVYLPQVADGLIISQEMLEKMLACTNEERHLDPITQLQDLGHPYFALWTQEISKSCHQQPGAQTTPLRKALFGEEIDASLLDGTFYKNEPTAARYCQLYWTARQKIKEDKESAKQAVSILISKEAHKLIEEFPQYNTLADIFGAIIGSLKNNLDKNVITRNAILDILYICAVLSVRVFKNTDINKHMVIYKSFEHMQELLPYALPGKLDRFGNDHFKAIFIDMLIKYGYVPKLPERKKVSRCEIIGLKNQRLSPLESRYKLDLIAQPTTKEEIELCLQDHLNDINVPFFSTEQLPTYIVGDYPAAKLWRKTIFDFITRYLDEERALTLLKRLTDNCEMRDETLQLMQELRTQGTAVILQQMYAHAIAPFPENEIEAQEYFNDYVAHQEMREHIEAIIRPQAGNTPRANNETEQTCQNWFANKFFKQYQTSEKEHLLLTITTIHPFWLPAQLPSIRNSELRSEKNALAWMYNHDIIPCTNATEFSECLWDYARGFYGVTDFFDRSLWQNNELVQTVITSANDANGKNNNHWSDLFIGLITHKPEMKIALTTILKRLKPSWDKNSNPQNHTTNWTIFEEKLQKALQHPSALIYPSAPTISETDRSDVNTDTENHSGLYPNYPYFFSDQTPPSAPTDPEPYQKQPLQPQPA
ncbi:MAG: hypothetical protein KAS93_03125 [Gammaproteobacteria bacterium]|nr:hypothetical protein [Gammaproteobacteria bacterium]